MIIKYGVGYEVYILNSPREGCIMLLAQQHQWWTVNTQLLVQPQFHHWQQAAGHRAHSGLSCGYTVLKTNKISLINEITTSCMPTALF